MGLLGKLRGKKRKQKQEQRRDPGSSGVLFWFNWQEISDAGHRLYGRYVYQHVLPLFAPSPLELPYGLYFFFDGDCLPRESVEIPFQGLEESLCLRAVKGRGVENCYVVAVYGKGGIDFAEIHRELGGSGMVGYVGKTSCPGMSLEAFESLVRKMGLPFAFALQGALFKKSSFAFVGDEQLRVWGFEPVDQEW